MGRRMRRGPIRRAFAGRRARVQSYRGTSQSSPQTTASTKSSTPNQTTQSKPAPSKEDTSVAKGQASRTESASTDEAAKNKATSLLGNMFGSGNKDAEASEAPQNTETPDKKQGGFSARDLTSGISHLFSGNGLKALTGATQSFKFDDKERKRAEAGLAALKKMAGKDGVLTPSDRENIIGQMNGALTVEKNRTVSSIANHKIQQAKNNRGPLRKALFPRAPLISSVGAKRKAQALNDPQHMNTARNTALGQLNQGFKDMGMDTQAPVSFQRGLNEARALPAIGLNDTNAFKDTMLMVQQKAKSMGLPEGQFKKGLPVGFLQDVLGGKPAATLLKHQVNPFGK